jgi:hypothetical protein
MAGGIFIISIYVCLCIMTATITDFFGYLKEDGNAHVPGLSILFVIGVFIFLFLMYFGRSKKF